MKATKIYRRQFEGGCFRGTASPPYLRRYLRAWWFEGHLCGNHSHINLDTWSEAKLYRHDVAHLRRKGIRWIGWTSRTLMKYGKIFGHDY